jgi:hypothetical protein
VEYQNYSFDLVQFDQIPALAPQLLGPDEITTARCESASSAGNIEAVEANEAEAVCEKRVGLFLKATI